MSVIKLFAGVAGTAAVQSVGIDVPSDGVLEAVALGVVFSIDATPAAGDSIMAELSFLSSETFAIHDVRGSLCVASAMILTTLANSPAIPSLPFCFFNGIDVPVNAGERIFLHLQASAADLTGNATGYLFIRDRVTGRARQRRR